MKQENGTKPPGWQITVGADLKAPMRILAAKRETSVGELADEILRDVVKPRRKPKIKATA